MHQGLDAVRGLAVQILGDVMPRIAQADFASVRRWRESASITTKRTKQPEVADSGSTANFK